MSKPLAWSYSSLAAFETCPRRYYLTRVSKEVVEPEGEPARWGNEVHKAMQDALTKDTPLPKSMKKWQKYIDKTKHMADRPGATLDAELQMAMNRQLIPVDWWDKDVWVRAIIDVLITHRNKAVALDWKTGKIKPDLDQLKLFAAFVMHKMPWIDHVYTGFIWLKDDKVTRDRFTRADITNIWGAFVPRVKRIEVAQARDQWLPKPSGLCKNWCPCTSCEFCGKGTR